MSKKPVIKNWKDADKAMARMAYLRNTINAANSEMWPQIEVLKRELASTVEPLNEALDELDVALKAFAIDHTSEFGESRYKKMVNGKISIRNVSSVEFVDSEINTVELMRQLGFGQYIKSQSSVVKAGLKHLTPEQLRSIGVRVVTRTSANIELK